MHVKCIHIYLYHNFIKRTVHRVGCLKSQYTIQIIITMHIGAMILTLALQ